MCPLVVQYPVCFQHPEVTRVEEDASQVFSLPGTDMNFFSLSEIPRRRETDICVLVCIPICPPHTGIPTLASDVTSLCISFQYYWASNILLSQVWPRFSPGPYCMYLWKCDCYLDTISLLTREVELYFFNLQIYSTFCDSQIRFEPQWQSYSWE